MVKIATICRIPIWRKFAQIPWHVIPQPAATFQGAATGEFNGMLSQSHVSHCRVLPLDEITVMIPESHATLQGAVTWRNQCHDRATLQGVIIPSAILKIVCRHVLFFFVFNAVRALASGGFRIVSDTVVLHYFIAG